MNTYALLIGINDYPGKPLTQCVGDVEKIEAYLQQINSPERKVIIKKLLDKDASRENIIDHIRTFISLGKDDDVALIYYSGHGAQEESAGHFEDEQDGLLESMVCYSEAEITTAQLLADKELRYLLYSLPSNPHLVTVFDACHSGDIVRAFSDEDQNNGMVRRIAGAFPARRYEDFVFAGDKAIEKETAEGKLRVVIPYKNHIHLAACLSSESSWEDSKGGVFTRYLTQLLDTTKSNLTYLDIARWSKMSLKNITQKKQTPIVTVQGKGKLSAQSSWLNLYPEGVSFLPGIVANNKKNGWTYSRGSLLGVEEGMNVIITIDDQHQETLKVKKAGLETSELEIPDQLINTFSDTKTIFEATTELNTYETLKLYINEIDINLDVVNLIKTKLGTNKNVELVTSDEAHFYLNIFNKLVYFSLPQYDFQPLAQQISISGTNELTSQLNDQILSFIKWQHFYSLDNPAKDFDTCPIRITVVSNDLPAVDVTNETQILLPQEERNEDGEQYHQMEVIVKNVSKETLYVGVLTLCSDLAITSNPFAGTVIELPPGKSKKFYDHDEGKVTVNFDKYKEIYNWKEEWFYYKFIYNNFEDFSASIQNNEFLQPALSPPLTLTFEEVDLRIAKGEGSKLKEVKKKWGTCRTRIELANSSYNVPSGDLVKHSDAYAQSPELAPFIKELYFEEYFDGQKIVLRLKQNKNQTAEVANRDTDNLLVKFMNYVYKTSRRRKFLNQKNADGPVVIAEGDSWFLYPKPGVRDTLDYIMDKFHLLSLAEAGDEITDYLNNNELIKAVKEYKPKYVLISGGGNDILGAEIRDILKKNVANGQVALDFIDELKFQVKLDELAKGYKTFFEQIKNLQPDVIIFVHGYDYIRSNPDAKTIKKGWANRYMIEAEIKEHETRKKIIYYLVDAFNDLLKEFADQYPHVQYINNRTTVHDNEWMDEIHPNNIGYQKVANNFLAHMQS
ncbi:MAG: caspase family protein [Bacteroidota bacterium]|nr:caspase family protein [Bacteroidota bacterium]